jgi:hypothetical protein
MAFYIGNESSSVFERLSLTSFYSYESVSYDALFNITALNNIVILI